MKTNNNGNPVVKIGKKSIVLDRITASVSSNGSRPIITCGCCSGTGRAELGWAEWSTLKRLRASKAPLRAKDLKEKDRQVTAINNRLVALEELGLARRTGKDGRYWRWEALDENSRIKDS